MGLAGMYSHLEGFSWRPVMKLSRKACVALWKPQVVQSSSRRLPRRPGSRWLLLVHNPWSPRAKSKGPGSPCCTPPLAVIFSGPNRTKLSFELHKSLYLANLGATRRTPCRKQDPSIWLFSKSMVKKQRSSTSSWHRRHSNRSLFRTPTAATGGGRVSCSGALWPEGPLAYLLKHFWHSNSLEVLFQANQSSQSGSCSGALKGSRIITCFKNMTFFDVFPVWNGCVFLHVHQKKLYLVSTKGHENTNVFIF